MDLNTESNNKNDQIRTTEESSNNFTVIKDEYPNPARVLDLDQVPKSDQKQAHPINDQNPNLLSKTTFLTSDSNKLLTYNPHDQRQSSAIRIEGDSRSTQHMSANIIPSETKK